MSEGFEPADAVVRFLFVLGLDAEDVVVDVDLEFVRPEVMGVEADLESLLVILDLVIK